MPENKKHPFLEVGQIVRFKEKKELFREIENIFPGESLTSNYTQFFLKNAGLKGTISNIQYQPYISQKRKKDIYHIVLQEKEYDTYYICSDSYFELETKININESIPLIFGDDIYNGM